MLRVVGPFRVRPQWWESHVADAVLRADVVIVVEIKVEDCVVVFIGTFPNCLQTRLLNMAKTDKQKKNNNRRIGKIENN